MRNHGKSAGPGIPRLLPSFLSARAGPRVSESLSTAWLIVKSLCFFSNLLSGLMVPLFFQFLIIFPGQGQVKNFLSLFPSPFLSFLLP